ncbi:MAG: GDSL-type esterase/lipase family protein [Planctomycetota bacterium]
MGWIRGCGRVSAPVLGAMMMASALVGCEGGFMASSREPDEPVADPARFEGSIVMYGATDRAIVPARKRVLYLGSSSIRRWDTGAAFDDVAGYNRGFGGSQISDSIHYFDRLVTPYKPEVIVFYAGDNDINFGKSSDKVVADFEAFVALMREKTPGTRLVFIAIKPSVKRWELWPQMQEANDRIEAICAGADDLFFADIAAPMLETGEPPSPTLFAKDGLHLSPTGEEMWVSVIDPIIGAARR